MSGEELPDKGEDVAVVATSGPSFLKDSLTVAVATITGQALAYLLNVMGPRFLSPSDFGALGSLFSLLVIASVLPFGVQAVAARAVISTEPAQRRQVGTRLLRFSVVTGLGLAGGLCLAAPALTELLRQSSVWNVLLVAATLPALNVAACQYALAQANGDFTRLALLLVLHGALRFGTGAVCLAWTGSVTTTLLGMCLGATASACVGLLLVERFAGRQSLPIPDLGLQTLHASHMLLVFFLATNIDLLLARFFLTGEESGSYAVGVVISRVVFWLPFFIILVAFPRMVEGGRRSTTLKAVLAVATLGVVCVALLLVVPDTVISAVAGSGYLFMASYVWLFGLIGALFSVARVLLYSQLAAADRRAAMILWIDVLAIIAVVSAWHSSVVVIAGLTAGGAFLLIALGLVLLFTEKRP